jgi:uncharacterized damage-inducible protein DinB
VLYPVELRVRLSADDGIVYIVALKGPPGGGEEEGMALDKIPEPWLRGTLQEVPAVQRAVLHALELAEEDVKLWCAGLTDEQLNARPCGLPSVAFQLRHIARSLDRLLTYAEGRSLSNEQLAALQEESAADAIGDDLFRELEGAIRVGATRIWALGDSALEQVRNVGRRQLPTTVGGLFVHVADHTQRHVGQAITTAKVVLAQRADL